MGETLQNILIILLPMWILVDNRGVTLINHWPVTVGLLAGLIMGDVTTAMKIAGTFQLMSLGVAALGGSSIPEYSLATVVAIFLNARTDADIGTAVAVGLPVGILALNLDVLTHTLNSFIANRSKRYMDNHEFKKAHYINIVSIILVTMQAFVPMVILVWFGPAAVQAVIDWVPEWVTNGFNIAGGILPVVGIAMLLRFMPAGRYLWAIIIGFVFTAYLELPILAISLIGFALALVVFANMSKQQGATAEVVANQETEGWDFDE